MGEKIFEKHSDTNWVGSYYDSLYGLILFWPGVHFPSLPGPPLVF